LIPSNEINHQLTSNIIIILHWEKCVPILYFSLGIWDVQKDANPALNIFLKERQELCHNFY
jgi:hypothetical protein